MNRFDHITDGDIITIWNKYNPSLDVTINHFLNPVPKQKVYFVDGLFLRPFEVELLEQDTRVTLITDPLAIASIDKFVERVKTVIMSPCLDEEIKNTLQDINPNYEFVSIDPVIQTVTVLNTVTDIKQAVHYSSMSYIGVELMKVLSTPSSKV